MLRKRAARVKELIGSRAIGAGGDNGEPALEPSLVRTVLAAIRERGSDGVTLRTLPHCLHTAAGGDGNALAAGDSTGCGDGDASATGHVTGCKKGIAEAAATSEPQQVLIL